MSTTSARVAPTETEVLAYFETLSNWGRWGAEDELGTLNLITPDKRRAAAALVREGISVGCARPIAHEPPAVDVPRPPLHAMLSTGETQVPRRGASGDYFGIAPHGFTVSHVDALSHQFWDGRMYNGRPSTAVTASAGATACSIEVMKDGIVTRGVLLDIAGLQNKPFLEAGEGVFPEDLEAAEARQGVRLTSGDALLLRTGWYRRRLEQGPYHEPASRPGLHAAALPWLHQRGIAVVASDASHDCTPSGYSFSPIHSVGCVAMGLCLVDACQFEDLVAQCAARGRWEFLFVIAPWRWRNATASPATPLAVL
jgi:kynurenine formamidase